MGGLGSQMIGEAVKRLDRLAPNVVQICGFVCEWIYKSPINTPGGFMGVTVWGSCQTTGLIRTKFGTRLRIRLGMYIG